jgi:hypothetical protein
MKKELCAKLAIYKDYTEMHGQQNIKENEISGACGTYRGEKGRMQGFGGET